MLSFDTVAWKPVSPLPALLWAFWFLSSHFSKTSNGRIYLQTRSVVRKFVRVYYTSCGYECGWAASSFFRGAQFQFSRKENRKLLQLAPVTHAWQEGVWSPSNNLTLADFLVTSKRCPSFFFFFFKSIKCNNSEAVWGNFFSPRQFFCVKTVRVLRIFLMKKSSLYSVCHVTIYLQIHLIYTVMYQLYQTNDDADIVHWMVQCTEHLPLPVENLSPALCLSFLNIQFKIFLWQIIVFWPNIL